MFDSSLPNHTQLFHGYFFTPLIPFSSVFCLLLAFKADCVFSSLLSIRILHPFVWTFLLTTLHSLFFPFFLLQKASASRAGGIRVSIISAAVSARHKSRRNGGLRCRRARSLHSKVSVWEGAVFASSFFLLFTMGRFFFLFYSVFFSLCDTVCITRLKK